MPNEWYEWASRLKDVGEEYHATRFAVARLSEEIQRDPGIVHGIVAIKHIRHAEKFLEGTYVIRMFAEFETALRQFWSTRRPTNPTMKDLVDGIASRKRIDPNYIDAVHRVREYRNDLIHERVERFVPIPISSVQNHLCHFISYLGSW